MANTYQPNNSTSGVCTIPADTKLEQQISQALSHHLGKPAACLVAQPALPQYSGTLIEDLMGTVECAARKNLICLDEDAEIFEQPTPALLEAEARFWEGR